MDKFKEQLLLDTFESFKKTCIQISSNNSIESTVGITENDAYLLFRKIFVAIPKNLLQGENIDKSRKITSVNVEEFINILTRFIITKFFLFQTQENISSEYFPHNLQTFIFDIYGIINDCINYNDITKMELL